MVVIDPLDFLFRHDLKLEQVAVEGEESHRVEVQELAELGGLILLGYDQVLAADSVAAFKIKSRLVARDHTRFQRGGVDVETDVLRTLMAVDEVAHAMAGAMVVCLALFPEELACEHVELVSGCTGGEDGVRKGDVSLHDKSEVMTLFGSRCAESHCTGYVGGTIYILAAGIDEEKAVALDCDVGLGCSLVVYDRAMLVPSENGGEALVNAALVGQTECAETLAKLHFGEFAGRVLALHHHEETGKRHAIFLHCRAEVGDHGLVLDALQLGHAVAAEHGSASDVVVDAACGLGRVDEKTGLFRQLLHILLDSVVGTGLDSVFIKVAAYFVGEFLLVDEEHALFSVKIEEAYEHG